MAGITVIVKNEYGSMYSVNKVLRENKYYIRWDRMFKLLTENDSLIRITCSTNKFVFHSKDAVLRLAKEAVRRWNKSHPKAECLLAVRPADTFFSINKIEKTDEELIDKYVDELFDSIFGG